MRTGSMTFPSNIHDLSAGMDRFRRFTVVAAIYCMQTLAPAQASANTDPLELYGKEIVFDVMRNGAHVGQHRVDFKRTPGGLTVSVRMSIAIRFLGFDAYTYAYNSASQWRHGRLIHLNSNIDDDGTKKSVTVAAMGNGLSIQASDGHTVSSVPLYPTNHWNAGVLHASKVINTITGRVDDVRITLIGEDTVAFKGTTTEARHYRYSGDIKTDVWYDHYGRWVKMRFNASDGSTIEYHCRKCGADYGVEAAR